jgi:Fis family transcriptional regulator, factor for inversion stimulation protein
MNQISSAVLPSHTTPMSFERELSSPASDTRSLRQNVEIAVGRYFAQLEGQMVSDVYDMVLQEVEAPLLEAVMKYTRNNQTLASSVLGLNRGTLRKKLKRYGLL